MFLRHSKAFQADFLTKSSKSPVSIAKAINSEADYEYPFD